MRKWMIMVMMTASLLLAVPVSAAEEERPQIILMACHQQVGWGVYAKAVFVDDAGDIWRYESESGLPRDSAERLELLSETEEKERESIGRLADGRVEEIQSLIAAIQPEEVNSRSGNISDYGLDTFSAIRREDGKEAEVICLALWGDWIYKHTDVNARAVYLSLITEVLGRTPDSEEDALFERMSLSDFCGVEKSVFKDATVTLWENGTERTLERKEAAKKLAWLQSLAVTGKRSALTAEEGTITYLLTTPEGAKAEFTFSGDLLAQPDGMYTVEALSRKEIKSLENLKKAQDEIDKVKEDTRIRPKL